MAYFVYHIRAARHSGDIDQGYIGYTNNLARRSGEHFRALKKGKHPNYKLQAYFKEEEGVELVALISDLQTEQQAAQHESYYRPIKNVGLNIAVGGLKTYEERFEPKEYNVVEIPKPRIRVKQPIENLQVLPPRLKEERTKTEPSRGNVLRSKTFETKTAVVRDHVTEIYVEPVQFKATPTRKEIANHKRQKEVEAQAQHLRLQKQARKDREIKRTQTIYAGGLQMERTKRPSLFQRFTNFISG